MGTLTYKRKALNNLIIHLLFVLCLQVHRVVGISKAFREIILDPINMSTEDNKVIQHTDLPMVTDEVSVTLRLNLLSHDLAKFVCVFHKGIINLEDVAKLEGNQDQVRTPSLYLIPIVSALHPRYSLTDDGNAGIDKVGDGLALNQWYHIAYALSAPEKRLDFYVDGQLVATQTILSEFVFNTGQLFIGTDFIHKGFTGQISKFRYYNWRLSADEVVENYLNISESTPVSSTISSQTTPTTQAQIPSNPSTSMTSIQPENIGKPNNIAAMAGISVGVSLGSIILTIICFLLYKSYKKKTKRQYHQQQYEVKQPGSEDILRIT